LEQHVSFVGEIAGHKKGVHSFNGDKFLVTKGPTIIEARTGDGGFLRDFIAKLLSGIDQPQCRCKGRLKSAAGGAEWRGGRKVQHLQIKKENVARYGTMGRYTP
jgi:hypothetical protein